MINLKRQQTSIRPFVRGLSEEEEEEEEEKEEEGLVAEERERKMC